MMGDEDHGGRREGASAEHTGDCNGRGGLHTVTPRLAGCREAFRVQRTQHVPREAFSDPPPHPCPQQPWLPGYKFSPACGTLDLSVTQVTTVTRSHSCSYLLGSSAPSAPHGVQSCAPAPHAAPGTPALHKYSLNALSSELGWGEALRPPLGIGVPQGPRLPAEPGRRCIHAPTRPRPHGDGR